MRTESTGSAKPDRLVKHHRVPGRPRRADDSERRPDERAFHDLVGHERLGVHVLEIPDPPSRLHLGVAGHGEVRTLLARWLRVARRGVAHGQCDVPRREVFAGADTEAGLALVEEITGGLALLGLHRLVAVIAPAVALPGVQRHTIARAD